MKLSTKEILTSSKKGTKMKLYNAHKPKNITFHDIINKKNNNNNNSIKKQKLVLNTISHYENPFIKPKFKTNQNSKSKTKIIRKNKNIKTSKLNIDTFHTNNNRLEDFSKVLFPTETHANKYKNPLKEKNIEISNFENENYFDEFYKENLKKTIIIDKNGNNNLNIPKKFIIQDDKNKKSKKISNTQGAKKYSSTNLLLTYKNMNKKNVLSKLEKNTKNNLNLNDDLRKNENINRIKNVLYKNLLSSKEIIPKDFLGINNGKNKKEKEEKKAPENNSIFEDYTNKSFDSSFLGSSLDDFFYNDLARKKELLWLLKFLFYNIFIERNNYY